MDPALINLAEQTLDHALRQGAAEAAVWVSRARFIQLKRREGRVETLRASTSRGLSVALFVEGRYSSNATGLLEPGRVRFFVDQTLAMTRRLAPDPHRALPDPALYGPTDAALDLEDPGYDGLAMDGREVMLEEVEGAARDVSGEIISVTAEMVTQASESLQIHSNGFRGEHRATSFLLGGTVTVRDGDDRRPEDHCWTVARHLGDLPTPREVGQLAARRALERRGSRKVESRPMTMVVENRAAGRLVASLLEPLSGAALQQRRSCFEGKLDQVVAAPSLTLTDEPLLPRGLGSRAYDGDGLAACPRPVFVAGRLRSYFIDVYYGRKLGVAPTSGSASNLTLLPGERTPQELLGAVERGILVTGFLGGNANAATGDFSFGVRGHAIRDGALEHPISEMNITGSHTTLWHALREVGNDPYPYSSLRIPTLVFDDVQFSGV
jgi:PmbA protein